MFKLRCLSYELLVVLLFILTVMFTVFLAKQPKALQAQQGPPIVCGKISEIGESIDKYEEEHFVVLMQSTPEAVYFILYRNISTGAWSLIA